MRLSHTCRFYSALVALFSMLFMQLALAGYACPVGGGESRTMVDTARLAHMADMAAMMASGHPMPHCEQMKRDIVPSLCHANAHAQHQSLDKHELPAVTSFIPSVLMLVFQPIDPAALLPRLTSDAALLARANAPPLIIRHCCFLI